MADDEEPSDWTSGLWPFRNEAEAKEPTRLIQLHGERTGDRFTLTSVSRMMGPAWWALPTTGGLRAILRDADGRELTRGELETGSGSAMATPGPHAGSALDAGTVIPTRAYFGTIRDVHGAAELLIVDRDDRTLLCLRAPDRPPEVRDVRASIEDETVRIAWTDDAPSDACQREIIWSSTRHLQPRTIAPRIDREEMQPGTASFPLWSLPPGLVFVRVLVHDVFRPIASDVVALSVPERRPHVEIADDLEEGRRRMSAALADPATSVSRSHLRHFVARQQPYDDPLPDSAFRWLLNGVEIGRGPKVSVRWQKSRRQLLTLGVTWAGGVCAICRRISSGPLPREMRWLWPEQCDPPPTEPR